MTANYHAKKTLKKKKLDVVLRAIRFNGNLNGWTFEVRLDPKWHSKDRFILLNEKGVPQAYLLLKLRKGSVGVQFGIHEYIWCEAIMEDWDENAVVSCLIMCAFSGCVPFARQRRVLGYHELENETPLSVQELKDVQSKIRKDCNGLKLPPVLNQAVSLLKKRYGELDGLDVKDSRTFSHVQVSSLQRYSI